MQNSMASSSWFCMKTKKIMAWKKRNETKPNTDLSPVKSFWCLSLISICYKSTVHVQCIYILFFSFRFFFAWLYFVSHHITCCNNVAILWLLGRFFCVICTLYIYIYWNTFIFSLLSFFCRLFALLDIFYDDVIIHIITIYPFIILYVFVFSCLNLVWVCFSRVFKLCCVMLVSMQYVGMCIIKSISVAISYKIVFTEMIWVEGTFLKFKFFKLFKDFSKTLKIESLDFF